MVYFPIFQFPCFSKKKFQPSVSLLFCFPTLLFPHITVSLHYCFLAFQKHVSRVCFPTLLFACFTVSRPVVSKLLKKFCDNLFPDRPPPSNFTVSLLFKIFKKFSSVYFPTVCFLAFLFPNTIDLFLARPPPSNCFTVSLLFKMFKKFHRIALLYPNIDDLFLDRRPPSKCFSKCSKSFPRSISPLFCFPTSTICFSTFQNIHLRSVSRPAAAKQLAASGAP